MNRKIRFGDLKINETARCYISQAMDKSWISQGDNVGEFEQRFAQKFGYRHAIATSSGTDADTCCCASLYYFGAERGGEIIVPALCFVACPNSILAAGFVPRFVDIELEMLNIDPLKIEGAISSKTRAIMAVHTMGKPCPMDSILEIAKAHDLRVIEDCCEAHNAQYKGKVVGSFGDMGAFSFYTAHQIVCGEGGMVVTEDDQIASAISSVKSHGRPPDKLYFDFQRIGFNSKMNDLEAAIGLGELLDFDHTFSKRRENMSNLLKLTEDLADCCYFPKEEDYEIISPHAFWLVLREDKNKEYGCGKLYRYLEARGIECKTLFGSLPTQHKAFGFLNYKYGDFPVAEYVGRNGLQFGIHQYLTDDDLDYIADALRSYFGKWSSV